MNQHQFDKLCVENCNIEILIRNKCFKTHLSSIGFNSICDQCIVNFYQTNRKEISDEIQQGNLNVISLNEYISMLIDLSPERLNAQELFAMGKYYANIKNYDLMKKYYLMAVDNNNADAMFFLGCYYGKTEHNNILAQKYYLMAHNHGRKYAIYNLGRYYQRRGFIDDAIKCYLLGIDSGCIPSMNELGLCYQYKDYDLMLKYFTMAIEHGCSNSMYNLGVYYEECKNYVEMEKYFVLALNHGDLDAKAKLLDYYKQTEQTENYESLQKYCVVNSSITVNI